jgi:hypothetical protein
MGKEHSLGQMDVYTEVNTNLESKVDMASSHGLMEKVTMDTGFRGNNME